MKITITITTDNAAFGDTPQDAGTEVARILKRLSEKLQDTDPGDYCGSKLVDVNGNTVGKISVLD